MLLCLLPKEFPREWLKAPATGFGIDLWHAVEFSRYERAKNITHFHGPVFRRLS